MRALTVFLVLIVLVSFVFAGIDSKDAKNNTGASVLEVHDDIATEEEMMNMEESALVLHVEKEAASTLSARTVTQKEKFDKDVESIIKKRLIPRIGKTRTCSFSCNHKQEKFIGCACKSLVTYTTRLSKCPTDVTQVSSTDLKWAWEQCAATRKQDCMCPSLSITVRQHRTVFAYEVIKAKNLLANNKNRETLLNQAINDVFTSPTLGYVSDDFKSNAQRYVKQFVEELLSELKIVQDIASMEKKTKEAAEAAASITQQVGRFFALEANERAKQVVEASDVWNSMANTAREKFGETGAEVIHTVQKYEGLVQKHEKTAALTTLKNNPLIQDLVKSLKLERKIAKAALKNSDDKKVQDAAKDKIAKTNKKLKSLKAPKCKAAPHK